MDIQTYILTVYDADGNPIEIPAIQGRGIASIVRTSGNGSAGTTDTYTITYTDNTTSTFCVYNGKDGTLYTLTDADKQEIAEAAAKTVDVPDVDDTLKISGAAADAKVVGGKFAEQSEAIADLGGVVIPNYWEEHLSKKIHAIQALQDLGGKDCFSFIVITDSHVCCQEGYLWQPISPTIAKRIADECDIKYILYLGDVNHRGSYNLKSQLERDNLWINETMFKPVKGKLLQTKGNHDSSYGNLDRDGDGTISNYSDGVLKNVEDRETYVYSLTDGETHRQIFRKVTTVGDVHFDESGTGYWIDDVANKVRYIMLNTNNTKYELREDGTQKYPSMWLFRFQQTQYDMAIEALKSIPSDDWNVVIGGHVPLDKSGEVTSWGGTNDNDSDCGLMKRMLTAYKNKTTFNGTFNGTASGSDKVADFTNLIDISSADFLDNTAMNANAEITTTGETGKFVSNFIPAVAPSKNSDTLRLEGFDISQPVYLVCYNSNKERILGFVSTNLTDVTIDENGVLSWKVGQSDGYISTANANALAYVRVSGRKKTTASELVATINEEITYTESGGDGYDKVTVDTDFQNAKGELVGFFGGHIHKDSDFADGIKIVTTRCDGIHENDETLKAERVVGTHTEYSFDVFTIDTKTKKIYATKIGAGDDREIDY